MVEVAGGERPGEEDDDVGVDGADNDDDNVADDDHGNVDYVFDVDVERKKLCKWLQESDWAAL